jgi:hypothetical protein
MTESGHEGKRKNERQRIARGDGRELVWIQEFRKLHAGVAKAAKASTRLALA